MIHMTKTSITTSDPDLADRLRRLADEWAPKVPRHHRAQAGAAVDRLAVLLGDLVGDDQLHAEVPR
jgi:hypothetical protein